MIEPLFDTCVICGRRTRTPGEPLCIFHDIQALIEIGAERMRHQIERLPTLPGKPVRIKRLQMTAIRKINGRKEIEV